MPLAHFAPTAERSAAGPGARPPRRAVGAEPPPTFGGPAHALACARRTLFVPTTIPAACRSDRGRTRGDGWLRPLVRAGSGTRREEAGRAGLPWRPGRLSGGPVGIPAPRDRAKQTWFGARGAFGPTLSRRG